MNLDVLKETAQVMVATGKGILAIDESHGTCKKRFDAIGVECTEETRRDYRGLLITAPVGDFISGMILFDETLRQKTDDGTPFPEALKSAESPRLALAPWLPAANWRHRPSATTIRSRWD